MIFFFFHHLKVRIYNIQIPSTDLDGYWQKIDMQRENSKIIISAHYNMNNQTDSK